MSHKKVMLMSIVVLGLSLFSVSAFAQGDDIGERVMVYPWEIWEGEITVSTDDTVVLGARWGACTKGLAKAWTKTSYINYVINGEPLFSSQKKALQYWGEPVQSTAPWQEFCVSASEGIWIVSWEYELGRLDEGTYVVGFEMGTEHPFHDGTDFDGDGEPDVQIYSFPFEFTIVSIEAGAISGTVFEQGGGPLEGLDVVACRFDNPEICLSAATDDAGNYSMYPVPEGDYRVFVYQQDFWLEEFFDDQPRWDLADPVTAIAGQDTSEVDFTLEMGGSISGLVTSESGDPIADLWVDACIYDAEWVCWGDMTQEDGSYSIRGIPAEQYRVGIFPQDFWMEEFFDDQPRWDWADPVTAIAGQDTSEVDFTLEMGGSISGLVTSESGDPIADLWVDACEYGVMEDPYCVSGETNDEGEYTIAGLPGGDYIVSIWDQGWVSQFYDVEVPYGDPDRVSVTPGVDHGGVVFALTQAGSISGRVVNELNEEESIPGIWVDTCEEAVFSEDMWGQDPFCSGDDTDDEGYYTIPGLIPGNYRVRIWDPIWGGEFYNDVSTFDDALLVPVVGGLETHGINFALVEPGSISGQVYEQGGGPLGGIDLMACLFDDSLCMGTLTAGDGNYTITGLPAGDYFVTVHQQGDWMKEFFNEVPFRYLATSVTVMSGADTPFIDFFLERGGSIAGTVFEESGGPIGGLDVVAVNFETDELRGGAPSEPDGSYLIQGLPAGTYRVFVYQQGYWAEEFYEETPFWDEATQVEVVAGAVAPDIHFTLVRSGSISGTVYEEGGGPLGGIDLMACLFDDGLCMGTLTAGDGSYTISGLPPGDYWVTTHQQDYWLEEFYDGVPIWDDATLVAVYAGEETSPINFWLMQGGTISGRVVTEIGSDPLDEIWVTACEYDVQQDPFCKGEWSRDGGFYSIEGLPAGNYRVNTYHPDWPNEYYENVSHWEDASPVNVQAGAITPDINFTLEQAASISGMVVNTFGHEIVGIWVEVNDFYTHNWAGGAHTNTDGYYSVSGLTPGDYRICIWDQSWVHQCYNMALPGAETIVTLVSGEHRGDIDFTLTQAGSISGNVIDEDGIFIVGIGVGACQHDEVDPVCYGNYTDNQGNYTLSGMIPDEYLVFVWDQEGWVNQLFDHTQDFSIATPVLVVAGQDTGGITFTLTPAFP